MSIKPSAAAEIRTLIAALASDGELQREAAVARLAIIGARAVERLVAAYPSATAGTRIAILRALEAIGDPRALAPARQALDEGGPVAVAAVGTLRALLHATNAAAATGALDTLVAIALDPVRGRTLRLGAIDALHDAAPDVHERLDAALADDADPAVRARAEDLPTDAALADAAWLDASEGRLSDDPTAVGDAVRLRGATAPLSILQTLVDRIREREAQADPAQRAAWTVTRGAIHQALALRASRIALYDLRETIEAATAPLPPSFLSALHAVGDESCLPALAAAHRRADGDESWREQLEAAFHAIVKREKLGRKKSAKLLKPRQG